MEMRSEHCVLIPEMLNVMKSSFFDANYDYNEYWKVTDVKPALNSRQQLDLFRQKQNEIVIRNRNSAETCCRHLFAVYSSRERVESILENGFQIKNAQLDVLGDGSKGVTLLQHCDIILKLEELAERQQLFVVALKVICGRAEAVYPAESGLKRQPSLRADCHISAVIPSVNESLKQQLLKSYVYLFDRDFHNSFSFADPLRQCLPVGVIEFTSKSWTLSSYFPPNVPCSIPSEPRAEDLPTCPPQRVHKYQTPHGTQSAINELPLTCPPQPVYQTQETQNVINDQTWCDMSFADYEQMRRLSTDMCLSEETCMSNDASASMYPMSKTSDIPPEECLIGFQARYIKLGMQVICNVHLRTSIHLARLVPYPEHLQLVQSTNQALAQYERIYDQRVLKISSVFTRCAANAQKIVNSEKADDLLKASCKKVFMNILMPVAKHLNFCLVSERALEGNLVKNAIHVCNHFLDVKLTLYQALEWFEFGINVMMQRMLGQGCVNSPESPKCQSPDEAHELNFNQNQEALQRGRKRLLEDTDCSKQSHKNQQLRTNFEYRGQTQESMSQQPDKRPANICQDSLPVFDSYPQRSVQLLKSYHLPEQLRLPLESTQQQAPLKFRQPYHPQYLQQFFQQGQQFQQETHQPFQRQFPQQSGQQHQQRVPQQLQPQFQQKLQQQSRQQSSEPIEHLSLRQQHDHLQSRQQFPDEQFHPAHDVRSIDWHRSMSPENGETYSRQPNSQGQRQFRSELQSPSSSELQYARELLAQSIHHRQQQTSQQQLGVHEEHNSDSSSTIPVRRTTPAADGRSYGNQSVLGLESATDCYAAMEFATRTRPDLESSPMSESSSEWDVWNDLGNTFFDTKLISEYVYLDGILNFPVRSISTDNAGCAAAGNNAISSLRTDNGAQNRYRPRSQSTGLDANGRQSAGIPADDPKTTESNRGLNANVATFAQSETDRRNTASSNTDKKIVKKSYFNNNKRSNSLLAKLLSDPGPCYSKATEPIQRTASVKIKVPPTMILISADEDDQEEDGFCGLLSNPERFTGI